MGSISHNALLSNIFKAAISAVDPYESVKPYIAKIRTSYKEGNFKKLILIGFGKASCPMAQAVEEELADVITDGIVITKYGHCRKHTLQAIAVQEAGHPVPDNNGLEGSAKLMDLVRSANGRALIVCLISGGGSALLVSPVEGISLGEKQRLTQQLLNAGADIFEVNTVRKHVSRIKGGRLAELASPASVISLIMSDVIGNRLDVIASGPTAPDTSTYLDAVHVLDKYSLTDKMPHSIRKILTKGKNGEIPETPKTDNSVFDSVENIIVGSSESAIEASSQKAKEYDFDTEIISTRMTGEAQEIGRWFGQKAVRIKEIKHSGRPLLFITGGETTVTVTGSGLGGRNTELALSFALTVQGIDGISLLSAGTDGTDGPTDAAGAFVNGKTVGHAQQLGLDPENYLRNNDSYNFFKKINSLFITGPTGTNVMDIQMVIVE
jgi:glycerate-2-kinase